jgi:GMP synthase (glutamine-hydrolysing)
VHDVIITKEAPNYRGGVGGRVGKGNPDLDFGSQYTMLIARRVRELKVLQRDPPLQRRDRRHPLLRPVRLIVRRAVQRVRGKSPRIPRELLSLGVPVLGICYGMQLIADLLGGEVGRSEDREYGIARIRGQWGSPLFLGIEEFRRDMEIPVWMSHGDRIDRLPDGFSSIASSNSTPVAAMANREGTIFGVQFHPEVAHTPRGKEMLSNFLFASAAFRPPGRCTPSRKPASGG